MGRSESTQVVNHAANGDVSWVAVFSIVAREFLGGVNILPRANEIGEANCFVLVRAHLRS